MRSPLRPVALLAMLAPLAAIPAARAQDAATAKPLARYFPAEALVVYAEFDGLDAHDAAWKKSSAYRLLTETSTGAMLDALATQLLDRALASASATGKGKGKNPTGAEVMSAVKGLLRSGFAFAINRRPNEEKPSSFGLVLRGAAKGPTRDLIGRLLDSARSADVRETTLDKPGGRRVAVLADKGGAGLAWWHEGDDLAFSLVIPQNVDAMLDALDGRKPSAATDPTRIALAKSDAGFEPVGLAFFERSALPPLPPQAEALGLDKIQRADYRWGFEGDAIVTVTRIVAPSPRTGLLALLDAPTFSAKDLPSIPPTADEFTAFAVDLDRFYERAVSCAALADQSVIDQAAAMEAAFREATGVSLRQDLLKHIGPRVVAYRIPSRGVLPTNPIVGFVSGYAHVTKAVMIVEIRDREGFAKTFDTFVARTNRAVRAQSGLGPEGAKSLGFVPLDGVDRGYVVAFPPALLPLPAGMRPAIILGKGSLIVGTTPAVARDALAREGKPADLAGGPLAGAIDRLPGKTSFVAVENARESLLPELVANLPTLIAAFGPGDLKVSWARILGVRIPDDGGKADAPLVNIHPDLIPDPDSLRPFLAPSVYSFHVTDEGFAFRTRESVPAVNPLAAAPIAAALMLPAVSSARVAARRSQSINNLKQIGLAMHNYHQANNKFPGDIVDKDGKPLLSWRVAILPYLEQQALYQEFHLDEPWDSPHNKPLMDRLPPTYAIPGAAADPGKTFYRGFLGASAFFDPNAKEGVSMANITDGTSNTIGVVEARDAVEWTKPGSDIPFDPKDENPAGLLEKLGGHFPGGFNALMLDGSVKFLSEALAPTILKKLITRDAGEVIQADF